MTTIPGNKFLDRLRHDYEGYCERYDEILTRCAENGRDPDEMEARSLDELRETMLPIGERIVELRDDWDRRYKAVTAFGGGDQPGAPVPVVAGSDGGMAPPADAALQGRGGIPPLLFGERQLRQMMAAVQARSALTLDMEPRSPACRTGPPWPPRPGRSSAPGRSRSR